MSDPAEPEVEEFIDESVGDDVDAEDDGVVGQGLDATGDHPGDVTNPTYAEELSINRSVPSVELGGTYEDALHEPMES